MARTDPQLKIRLPPDAKVFIEAEARENASSQNSEIVRAIRAAMKAKGPAEGATSPSHGHNFPDQGKADEQHDQ
ncbi:Arc family DNA-binding protein [Paradevosia shaoguanensis]|uniref:Arc family DNA-binding protein n=1 Tax=Paradevosia shaoguanensis TaxID=1335043 RepID=UPI0019320B6C|nr:Arc family DNA-binding protein [Paradevosia shaoguanensis]